MDIYDMHSFIRNVSNGYDTDGNKQAATPVAMNGLIERKSRLVIDSEGEEIMSDANIYFCYTPGITMEDSVTFDGREWRIVKIYHPQDFASQKTQIFLV